MNREEKQKPWCCKNGHVMGQVHRNGSGVRVLLLYRQALDMVSQSELADEVDVMAVIEGYVADVRCSICDAVRTWVPGEEAMRELVKRVLAMRQSLRDEP